MSTPATPSTPKHNEVLPPDTTQQELEARMEALQAAGWQNCKLVQEQGQYHIHCTGFE